MNQAPCHRCEIGYSPSLRGLTPPESHQLPCEPWGPPLFLGLCPCSVPNDYCLVLHRLVTSRSLLSFAFEASLAPGSLRTT